MKQRTHHSTRQSNSKKSNLILNETTAKNSESRNAKNKTGNSKKLLSKLIVCTILVALTLSIALCFTACNKEIAVKEGWITEKMFGHPTFETKGSFSFIIAGDEDYFFKVENDGKFQWYRIRSLDMYYNLEIGDWFEYEPSTCIPVFNFLDRG